MSLTLRIENYDYLEDGGPVSHTVGPRGAQVGRGAGMDWVLPDPSRHISSHHFDIVAQDGSYWLTDVSTNGTFLVGQRYRLDGPHQLQPGDRFQVGPYIIAVEAAAGLAPQPGGADARPAIAPAPPGSWPSEEDPWAVGGGGLPPVDPLPPARIGRAEDFGDELIAPPTFAAPAPDPVGGAPISVPPALSRPDPSHAGSEPLPGASVLAPPSAEGLAGGAQVSMPPARPVSPPPEPEPGPPEPQAGPAPIPPAPQPTPAPIPDAAPTPAPASPAGDPAGFVAAFCEGAGLEPSNYADTDAARLARMLGEAVRASVEEQMTHLRARAGFREQSRAHIDRTMLGLAGTNPLKTAHHPSKAIEAAFLRPVAGAATGAEALGGAARDLRLHHEALIAAIQPALGALIHDLAPEAIEAGTGKGLALGGGRRAKNWESFVERWDNKASRHDNGMLDAYFEELARFYGEAHKTDDVER